ncbi:DUF84 family protein [Bacillus shivajii]|uniref:DUF84 family protein n=1 Tax=Bacillus shivajii TaxID=1983719 RepID=UPI001CF9D657|nr:DUF84 family protein [Bacillus shivajii]UCZ52326.1 DUF84 family protein [Bacillus shivajii]
MKIGIGSTNEAKVQAVKSVFNDTYDIEALSVQSEVSNQPFSDLETKQGAIHRARNIVLNDSFEIGIGLEGGVAEENHQMFICNWGSLVTKSGQVFIAGGARIPLPDEIADELRKGEELGDVIDRWTNKTGVRKNEGTVGVLTMGIVTRDKMFEHVVQLLYGQWMFHEETKK